VFEGYTKIAKHVNGAVDADVKPVELASDLVYVCYGLLKQLEIVYDVVCCVEAVRLWLVVLLNVLVLKSLC
jgi:hypothetical protein